MGLLTQSMIIRARMTKSFLPEWINFHSTGGTAAPPVPPPRTPMHMTKYVRLVG